MGQGRTEQRELPTAKATYEMSAGVRSRMSTGAYMHITSPKQQTRVKSRPTQSSWHLQVHNTRESLRVCFEDRAVI